jgi:hypothetical protein
MARLKANYYEAKINEADLVARSIANDHLNFEDRISDLT